MSDYAKILLAKCESHGNLVKYKQSYYVYYYGKTEDKCDKILMEIVAPSSNGEDAVKSYFMVDPSNVELLIQDLEKALFFFKRQRNEFNENNILYWISQRQRKTSEIARDVLKGLFDEGVRI